MAKKSNKNNKRVKLVPLIETGDMEPRPVEESHFKISKDVEEMKQPALLCSRANYPVTVKYDKSVIRISPRGKVKIADLGKLQKPIPSEILISKR